MRAYYWLGCKKLSLVNSNHSHIASFAANIKAIYLASMDDKETVAYFLKHQLTGPPFSMKIKPEVNLQLFLSPTQLKSK